jgi:hypothetical protein
VGAPIGEPGVRERRSAEQDESEGGGEHGVRSWGAEVRSEPSCSLADCPKFHLPPPDWSTKAHAMWYGAVLPSALQTSATGVGEIRMRYRPRLCFLLLQPEIVCDHVLRIQPRYQPTETIWMAQ